MNAMIVDDERLAIDRLCSLLKPYKDIEVTATTQDANEVMVLLERYRIDVIFLDINMPDVDGLALARRIRRYEKPVEIIFITGHDSYAVEAFEVQAMDYLMKPVRRERFDQTVNILRSKLGEGAYAEHNQQCLKVRTFGGFNCAFGSEEAGYRNLKWRTKKVKELFAYLLDNHEQEIHRHKIIENLWGEFEITKANNNLNTNLYYLRKQLQELGLEQLLKSDKESVMFTKNSQVDIDFTVFDIWIKNSSHPNLIEGVLDLYRGDYLEAEGYLWSMARAAHYKHQYERAVDQWLSRLHKGVDIERLYKIISYHPYSEKLRMILIASLKKEGRYHLAKLQYEQMEIMVMEEFGAKPTKTYDEI